MSERSPKPEQAPPMVMAIEATKEFYEKIEEKDEFKKIRNSILNKLGSNSSEAEETATKMVKSGVGMAMQRVGMLPAFANPEKRKEVLEQLEKDKVEGAWIGIMANWDVNSDPNGTGVLEACKKSDINEIKSKVDEATGEEQKAQIHTQADAIAKGQDLIISYYKKNLNSSTHQKAA